MLDFAAPVKRPAVAPPTPERSPTAGRMSEAHSLMRRLGNQGMAEATGGLRDAARDGVSGPGGALPHLATLQERFGHHDLSGVTAHTAPGATDAVGASAYALGEKVAFSHDKPSLYDAAHEAAHVVQHRAGVDTPISREGDRYEAHAHRVAETVAAGRSAEGLLDSAPRAAAPAAAPAVMGLWTRATAKTKMKIGWRIRSGAYKAILTMFQQWHDRVHEQPTGAKVDFLERLLAKVDAYLAAKDAKRDALDASTAAWRTRNTENQGIRDVRANVAQELTTVSAGHTALTRPGALGTAWTRDLEADAVGFDGERMHGGLNSLREVPMVGTGVTGMFKPEEDMHTHPITAREAGIPQTGQDQSGRAVAAYRMDRLLGLGVIPETFRASYGTTAGSLMRKITDAVPALSQHERLMMQSDHLEPEHQQELSKLYLFDALIGQVDRHMENMMVQGDKLWGIDNDLSFGKDYAIDADSGRVSGTIKGKSPRALRIDAEFAARIIELSKHPDWVQAELAGLITDTEIDATLARLQALATYLRKRLDEGTRVVTDWG
ncbi:MAG: DUF4157 domain-containing protein [Alphaproteobacteria bacterium]|nr:DUF4157 domain-containing protein [Alphaproteobacteria bacterium]